MIYRYYELRCDYCGCVINHYPIRKPDNELLRKEGILHTSTKQFCSDECFANWNHDRQAKQYFNLRQQGRINNK